MKPYTAFVLNRQSATLAAVNLADFHVTASLPVTSAPERVVLRPGTHQLYVVSSTGKICVAAFPHPHIVATIDIGRSAHGLAFSRDGRTAYVLDPEGHELVFLDCEGVGSNHGDGTIPKVSFRLRLGGKPSELALSPDGKTLVTASENPGQLTFLSADTRQSLGTIDVGRALGPWRFCRTIRKSL